MKLDKRFDKQFSDVVRMIHDARFNAIKHVNVELVKLYWNVGMYIGKKLATAEWVMRWYIVWPIKFRVNILNLKGSLAAVSTGCGSFMKHMGKKRLCQQC